MFPNIRCSTDRLPMILGGLFVVALFTGLGGCSKDDNPPYDFNGTWAAAYQVVESTAGYIPVGLTSTGTAIIDQKDADIVVTLGTGFPMSGTCDPLAKTFSVTDLVGATQRVLSGQAEDGNTLSGTLTLNKNQDRVILSWTMDLTSRVKGTAGDGSGECSIAGSLACALAGH